MPQVTIIDVNMTQKPLGLRKGLLQCKGAVLLIEEWRTVQMLCWKHVCHDRSILCHKHFSWKETFRKVYLQFFYKLLHLLSFLFKAVFHLTCSFDITFWLYNISFWKYKNHINVNEKLLFTFRFHEVTVRKSLQKDRRGTLRADGTWPVHTWELACASEESLSVCLLLKGSCLQARGCEDTGQMDPQTVTVMDQAGARPLPPPRSEWRMTQARPLPATRHLLLISEQRPPHDHTQTLFI